MWIWWIVSLIILIVCVIFAYRMIISSYDFLPADKKYWRGFKSRASSEKRLGRQQETITALKNKMQSIEENNAFYEIQISKFLKRLKVLEEHFNNSPQTQAGGQRAADEEDWKEMYYEENEVKERLENELDETRQQLEKSEDLLRELQKNSSNQIGMASDHEARLNDLHSMQNTIGLMQRQLEAAADRERELEKMLQAEIEIKKTYSQLEADHTRLQCENDDLKRQIIEMDRQELKLKSRSII